MKKKRVFKLMTAAGCALFAASAMGAVSDSFESPVAAGAAVDTLDGWIGYGTVTATNYTATGDSTVGRPIVQSSSSPANVLAIEGRATRTATTTANNAATVDMMVQIALPDDGLAFPANTTTTDIQIAVGVDTNSVANKGELKVYCKNKAGTATGWYSLGAVLDKDSWHRVSFTFDYANQLCQIRVDGDPAITENGVLKAGSAQNGGWYKLATNTEKTALAEVQIIGSTSIDDMLVSDAATVNEVLPAMEDASTPTTVDGVAIDKTWIEEQGITRAQAADNALDYETTGMTVAQKYAAGYDVADGKKFGVKEMTLTNSVATVTFDAATVQPGYSYVLATSTDNSTWVDGDPIDATKGTVSVTLDTAVKYLKLKVVK